MGFRRWFLLALATALLVLAWWRPRSDSRDAVFEPEVRLNEPAPVCPWREPAADLKAYFPGATQYRTETRILSGKRLELQERLGHPPAENSLRVHRIFRSEEPLGAVLTQRVKGEHGVIELVLALGEDQAIRGLRLQRQREPELVLQALEDPDWLKAFVGKRADADWRLGGAVPELPEAARRSGGQIVLGVRTLLAMMLVSDDRAIVHRHH